MTAAGNEAVQCHCLCCPESSAVQSVSDSLLQFAAGIYHKISYYHNVWLLRENYADFVANLKIHSVYFIWLGKFRNRDWICYLKVCILQNIDCNVYIYKRILLPAFHLFPSDIWSSSGLTFLVQTSVPYAASYFPSPSAVHQCQLHVWLDPSDSWFQPIYSQPSHGKEKKWQNHSNKYPELCCEEIKFSPCLQPGISNYKLRPLKASATSLF